MSKFARNTLCIFSIFRGTCGLSLSKVIGFDKLNQHYRTLLRRYHATTEKDDDYVKISVWEQFMRTLTIKLLLILMMLFTLLGSSACADNTATPVPSTHTPFPTQEITVTEASAVSMATATAVSTQPPATAAAPPAPADLTYVWLSNGLANFSAVDTLSFDPDVPGVLYARTPEGAVSWHYQSEDGGVTWKPVEVDKNATEASVFPGLRVWRDLQMPTTLYGVNEETQTFVKSVDGGENWDSLTVPFSVMSLVEGMGVLTIDPRNPNTLFVSTWNSIYKSGDGGETWREMMAGIPDPAPSGFWEQRFIFDPSQPDTLFFLDSGGHGLYLSVNGGQQWTNLLLPDSYSRVRWLIIEPQDTHILYAATDAGQLYKSSNGGQNWQADNLGLPGDGGVQSLAINPNNPHERYAILQGGMDSLYKSEDGGQTWNQVQTTGFAAAPIHHLAIDPQTPGLIYAAAPTQSGEIVLKSADGGQTWTTILSPQLKFGFTGGDSVHSLVVGSQTPNTLYVGAAQAIYKTSDGGATWLEIYADYNLAHLNLDPTTPTALYIIKNPYNMGESGAQVLRSTDGGQSWLEMGHLPVNYQDSTDWLVFDPQNSNTLYTFLILNNGGLYKSTSAGGSWQPANWELPTESVIDHFAIDLQTTTTFFAAVSRPSPTLYKSMDEGQTWNEAKTGLPEAPVTAMVIDPAHPSTLYVAVLGQGVFRSGNGGETWQAISSTPFAFRINTLILDPHTTNTLYAGTNNGVWVIQPAGAG